MAQRAFKPPKANYLGSPSGSGRRQASTRLTVYNADRHQGRFGLTRCWFSFTLRRTQDGLIRERS
jgi:hypothetical protein